VADAPLLALDGVSVVYRRRRPRPDLLALDSVSLEVTTSRSVGIIGDSGAGKSTLCRVAEGLVRPSAGRVLIAGEDLTRGTIGAWRRVRRRAALVFQDAASSFNPMRPVVDSIGMALGASGEASRAEIKRAVAEVMEQVGLRPSQMTRYPHEFSGGQIQRLAIARALITRPRLILLDEPVSALDVSIRAQILNLLSDLASSLSLTYVVISSDPGVPRHLASEMIVLYGGRILERAPTHILFSKPLHPYTVSLLALHDPLVGELIDRSAYAHSKWGVDAETGLVEVEPGHAVDMRPFPAPRSWSRTEPMGGAQAAAH
jgi:ABC-type oligopeptide transport system ATPase subunit